MKPSPRESALGFSKDQHPVPPPSTSTSPPSIQNPQQLLPWHGEPRARHHHCSVAHSLWLKTDDNNESGQPSSALALLNNLGHGGYAGIRGGEAESPGPAKHDRDWTVTEQPLVSHRRINEAGDSVPSRHKRLCQPRHRRQWGSQGVCAVRSTSRRSQRIL